MRTNHLSLLGIGAVLAVAAACSDGYKASNYGPTSPFVPGDPPLLTLIGTISPINQLESGVVLSTIEGEDILLTGENAAPLAQILNAQVEVRGHWGYYGTFDVADFLVTRVEGVPVVDGILSYEPVSVDTDDAQALGYAIQLTRGGVVPLVDPPMELRSHLGARVWVAGLIDASPFSFGIIRE